MTFVSENEIEKFSFEDCEIKEIEIKDNEIELILNALIVLPNNSQNTNYTESYAGPTKMLFRDAKLISGKKLGYSYYDADDKLVEEIPDRILDEASITDIFKSCKGSYLYRAEKNVDGPYIIEVEFAPEEMYDTSATVSYMFEIEADRVIMSWDYYMSRVQR